MKIPLVAFLVLSSVAVPVALSTDTPLPPSRQAGILQRLSLPSFHLPFSLGNLFQKQQTPPKSSAVAKSATPTVQTTKSNVHEVTIVRGLVHKRQLVSVSVTPFNPFRAAPSSHSPYSALANPSLLPTYAKVGFGTSSASLDSVLADDNKSSNYWQMFSSSAVAESAADSDDGDDIAWRGLDGEGAEISNPANSIPPLFYWPNDIPTASAPERFSSDKVKEIATASQHTATVSVLADPLTTKTHAAATSSAISMKWATVTASLN